MLFPRDMRERVIDIPGVDAADKGGKNDPGLEGRPQSQANGQEIKDYHADQDHRALNDLSLNHLPKPGTNAAAKESGRVIFFHSLYFTL